MADLIIAPIVEGHGEVASLRILINTIFLEIIRSTSIPIVLKPIRVSKAKVIRQEDELLRAVDLAVLKLAGDAGARALILLLLDADDDPACELAPRLLRTLREQRANVSVACVIAVVEYETWFVAGAESLAQFWMPGYEPNVPRDPEAARSGKGWVQHHFVERKYSETVDQPRLTAALDVGLARRRSASFDKLCRDLEQWSK